MKTLALISCCLLAAGCGNWSNEDLQYLNAMPTRDQLLSKLPTPIDGGLRGEGTRRDALGVGEPSKLYADTKAASDGFNKILIGLLNIIDAVRSYPPTKRETGARIWGPWTDNENPGFEVQVTIVKVDDGNFSYQVEHRPKGGQFVVTVSGVFKPSKELRKGSGGLIIHTAALVGLGLKGLDGFKPLEKIEIAYVTDMYPVTVIMKFTNIPGQPVTTLEYGYQENADDSGGIGFRAFGTDPNILQLDTGSAWLPSGEGYGVLSVIEGNWKGATQFECWDSTFKTTFVHQTWPGGVTLGDKAACVSVENHPKPP